MSVIEVEDLVKSYDQNPVVDGISFTVEAGEIFAILGPNGAGKTTTVESISGLRRPDSGRIEVLGLDPLRDVTALRERLGVQLQESQLPDRIKVWEAMDLYASFYRAPTDWRTLLEPLGLDGKRDTKYSKLSGGQKQRLSVALALVGNPEVAILDELTTGLDPQARRDTWGVVEGLRQRGVTIVLVTHFMEEAERLADRVALIDSGRLVALDTPAGLVARASAEQRIRFLEVLQLVASGSSNRDVAEQLFISEATVKTHLLHIYAKLGVNDRAAAVGAAFERGLLTPGEGGR